VLEALGSYSYRYTMPALLDTALKGKYMNDPESRNSVDLIVRGFKLDTAWIYLETIGNRYPYRYREVIRNGEVTYASKHTSGANETKKVLAAYKKSFT